MSGGKVGKAALERPADTQWPRWEVFKQDNAKKPHQAVGSVHAADPEHALLTARNVFARRPSAVSMWVAPEEAIFSATQEQLEHHFHAPGGGEAGEEATYLVFVKTSHKRSMTFVDHLGAVRARSPQEALGRALETFGSEGALAWWLVPEAAIVKSDAEDAESWFEPAKDKTYKQQSSYGFVKPQSQEDAR